MCLRAIRGCVQLGHFYIISIVVTRMVSKDKIIHIFPGPHALNCVVAGYLLLKNMPIIERRFGNISTSDTENQGNLNAQ